MKLTKKNLLQLIKEEMGEYGSTFSGDSRDHADRILEDELDNTLKQIKDGMYKMMDSGEDAEMIDAHDQLKEVLKYILGK